MLLGVVADSHDNLDRIDQAIDVFNKQGVGLVLHAGDIIAPFALLRFKRLECNLVAVFGNNDGEHEGLHAACQSFGATIHEPPHALRLAGRSILLLHDIEMSGRQEQCRHDIVVHGHTHCPGLSSEGNTLLLNPGECGGWLTGVATVALIDTDSLTGRIQTLD